MAEPRPNLTPVEDIRAELFREYLPGLGEADANRMVGLTLVMHQVVKLGAPIDMVERLDTAALWPSVLTAEEAEEKELESDTIEVAAYRLALQSLQSQGISPDNVFNVHSTPAYAAATSSLTELQRFQPVQTAARGVARSVATSKMTRRLTDNPLLADPNVVCPAPEMLDRLLGGRSRGVQPEFKTSRADYLTHPNDPIRRTRMIHQMMVGIASHSLGIKPKLRLPPRIHPDM